MRLVLSSTLLACCLGVLGCGDRDQGPTACEIGPDIYFDSIAELVASQPACSSDADCVTVDTSIECSGISIGSCGDVMHRAAAALWSADAICERIEDASSPSKYFCSQEASCAAVRLACTAGVCGGR